MKKSFLLSIFFFSSSCLIIYPQFSKETVWCTGQGTGGYANKHWIGDFNGDNIDDKLQLVETGDWWVSISNGTTFTAEKRWAQNHDSGATKYFIGDFNGDEMDDILSYRQIGGIWKLSLAQQSAVNGEYSFAAPVQKTSGKYIHPVYNWVGDFNGDGIDEILSYSGELSVFKTYNSWIIQTGWSNTLESDILNDAYIGDFNGDGYDDLTYYKATDSIYGNDCWFVAYSVPDQDRFKFDPIEFWANDQVSNSNNYNFGDLNGDRRIDKLSFNSSEGSWYAALSTGSSFEDETLWYSSQNERVSGEFVGDFNGDNLCDITFYISYNGEWCVGLNTGVQEKIVAAWFTNWYFDGCSLWESQTRDTNKTPVIGWPDDPEQTVNAVYSSQDPNTLNLQIDAMIKAGIDLIIIDFTNGFFYDDGNWMNGAVHNATNKLFAVMKKRIDSGKKSIKISIGLGYEFWGPGLFRHYKSRYRTDSTHDEWLWVNWARQYQRQRKVLDEIYKRYVQGYPEIYFRYLNRPLVIAYINSEDYPPRENGNNIPLWHYNDFTIKKAVNWYSTFSRNTNVFVNGQDTKRYWGWGSLKDQPFNLEQMSVMPGTNNWMSYYRDNVSVEIKRDETSAGSYYIDSWKRIIEVNPNISIICDWNCWNEETAIEGCVGTKGWRDYTGKNQYDWYLQITQAYARIFKEGVIPSGTYFRDDIDQNIYFWDGASGIYQEELPTGKPVIVLPHNWIVKRGILGDE